MPYNDPNKASSGWRLQQGEWLLEEDTHPQWNSTGCQGWVLIIDDQLQRREELAAALTAQGYVAWFVEDLHQATDALRQADVFSAVILGLELTASEAKRFAAWLERTQSRCQLIAGAAGGDWRLLDAAPALRLIHTGANTGQRQVCTIDADIEGEGVTG